MNDYSDRWLLRLKQLYDYELEWTKSNWFDCMLFILMNEWKSYYNYWSTTDGFPVIYDFHLCYMITSNLVLPNYSKLDAPRLIFTKSIPKCFHSFRNIFCTQIKYRRRDNSCNSWSKISIHSLKWVTSIKLIFFIQHLHHIIAATPRVNDQSSHPRILFLFPYD